MARQLVSRNRRPFYSVAPFPQQGRMGDFVSRGNEGYPQGTFLIPLCVNRDEARRIYSAIEVGAHLIYGEDALRVIETYLQALEYINAPDVAGCWLMRTYRIANCRLQYRDDPADEWQNVPDSQSISDCIDQPQDGREVSMRAIQRQIDSETRTVVQWRYVGETDAQWRDLYVVPQGERGDDGRTPLITAERDNENDLLRVSWRYTDESASANRLVGTIPDGEDGRTPVITSERDEAQNRNEFYWRYDDEPEFVRRSLGFARDGEQGERGERGERGEDGQPGGIDVTDAQARCGAGAAFAAWLSNMLASWSEVYYETSFRFRGVEVQFPEPEPAFALKVQRLVGGADGYSIAAAEFYGDIVEMSDEDKSVGFAMLRSPQVRQGIACYVRDAGDGRIPTQVEMIAVAERLGIDDGLIDFPDAFGVMLREVTNALIDDAWGDIECVLREGARIGSEACECACAGDDGYEPFCRLYNFESSGGAPYGWVAEVDSDGNPLATFGIDWQSVTDEVQPPSAEFPNGTRRMTCFVRFPELSQTAAGQIEVDTVSVDLLWEMSDPEDDDNGYRNFQLTSVAGVANEGDFIRSGRQTIVMGTVGDYQGIAGFDFNVRLASGGLTQQPAPVGRVFITAIQVTGRKLPTVDLIEGLQC